MVKRREQVRTGAFFSVGRRASRGLTQATGRLSLSLCLLLALAASPAWGAAVDLTGSPVAAISDQPCVGTRAGASLGCTAKEFTVSTTFSAAPGTPPFCVAGNSFNFLVDLELSGSNANRYNITFYTGQTGNAPDVNDSTQLCTATAFPLSLASVPSSPWTNLDPPNTCADYLKGGDSIARVNQIKVKCQGDAAGYLSVPYTLAYDQNAGMPACTPGDPTTYPIPTTSKCQTGLSTVSGNVKVFSGAYVNVTKRTVPAGDSQPFTFSAAGPAGSAVIALTGSTTLSSAQPTDGTYTPPTAAAATNSVSGITLTDGQTARFYINALTTGQALTVTEAATATWETTAAITCSPVTGAPALTVNNASRTLTATLDSTNSAAACTIINTKRARITLVKNVGDRLATADQFTVSATGGGTLTGTTAATTAGTGTTASTTFYSSPNTALTLTDAMAPGSTSILANYDTRLTCTNAYTGPGATPNASLPANLATASADITPAPGDDITCTYTNTPKRPTLTKAFSTGSIGVGQTATLTFTITNPAGAAARTGLTFTDTFPANLVVAGNPGVVNGCGGTPALTATAGSGTFTVGGSGVNAAAGATSCTISVNVTSSAPLSGYVNGAAQITAISPALINGVTDQTLSVAQASLTKAFSPTSIVPGGRSTLTFTLTNGTGSPAQSGINFTDTLPANVTVASPPNVTTTCPSGTGVVAAAAGAGSIVVTGATMGSTQASCVITVDVTGTVLGGPYNNTSASISGTTRVTNSVVTTGLTIQTNATVTIRKVSNGGVGTFSFTGTSGIGNLSLTTVTAGVPVGSAVQTFSTLNAPATVTETVPPGWALTSATCVDDTNTTVPNTTLSNGTLTIPAAAITAGTSLTCTFTNTLLPSLTVIKSADKSNVTPGTVVTYTILIANSGAGSATGVTATDLMSPYTAFGLNTFGTGAPFQFADGTPASGLTLGTPVFSSDNGATWGYTPVSGGGGAPAGYDGNITNWRIPMSGTMNPSGANFTITYQVLVK